MSDSPALWRILDDTLKALHKTHPKHDAHREKAALAAAKLSGALATLRGERAKPRTNDAGPA